MWAVYALFQFPGGVLADRYGERRLVVLALTATNAGIIMVALASSLLQFFVFALLFEAGAGLFFAPASALITRLYIN